MPFQHDHLAGLLGSPAEGLVLLQVFLQTQAKQGTAAMSIAVMPLAKRILWTAVKYKSYMMCSHTCIAIKYKHKQMLCCEHDYTQYCTGQAN